MSILEEKETCETIAVKDDSEYRAFITASSAQIEFVPEQYQDCKGLVTKADGGSFAKWLHSAKPELKIKLRKSDGKLVLHSDDLWLPLAFLATDVALPVYLNFVASYLYDRARGALRGAKPRVHLQAVYEDRQDGIVKSFQFEGDVNALEKVVKRFDLNRFLEK